MIKQNSLLDPHWAPVRIRVAVYVEEQGKVLLVHDPVYRGGCWILPGGSAEFNETIIEAAERETFEETGLKIRVHSLWRIREIWEPENDYPDCPDATRKTLELIFVGDYISGEIDIGKNPSQKPDGVPRVKECRWVSIKQSDSWIDGVPIYPTELFGQQRPTEENRVPLEKLLFPPLELKRG